ncbi:MAG TPA: hypothetical protein PLO37_19620 [Candidatus Hydrogenedentes bacterium]|nr:hypothetical protein [Candidatus Hydrogenedentota bacterium]HPG69063.1 hypothetical protein [Candidatus Hydrogenedentota bacterium]
MPKHSKESIVPSDDTRRDAVRAILKTMVEGRQCGDLFDLFDAVEGVSDSVDTDLAWLAAYDMDPEVADVAAAVGYARLNYEMEEEGGISEDRCQSVLAIARKAIESPRVPTDRKLKLGTLVTMCGGDPALDSVLADLADSPEGHEQLLKDTLRQVASSRQNTEHFLTLTGFIADGAEGTEARGMSHDTVEFMIALCERLREEKPALAPLLLGTVLIAAVEQDATDSALDVMTALSGHQTPEARWCLDELGRWPGLGQFAVQARECADRLEAAGVPSKLGMRSSFSHGLVTSVDGAGSRSLCLLFHTRDGGMDALTFLLNDRVGMKDFWCLFTEGADLEEDMRYTDASEEVTLAYCPLSFARKLVADAWAIHEETGVPLPARFFLNRYLLGEEPIRPERHQPELSAYALDRLPLTPDLFHGDLDDVVGFAPFTDLVFSSDEAYAFVADHAPAKGRNLAKAKRVKFAKEVAILERETLLQRTALNLEIEALAGHGADQEVRFASRIYLGIRENVLPFHAIPFVAKLCEISTARILTNIRLGFSSQAEANAAATEEDAASWGDEDDYDSFDDDPTPF